MTNKITNWIKADEVSEEGLYILNVGDAESLETSEIVHIAKDPDDDLVITYKYDPFVHTVKSSHHSWKFTKLEF